MEGKGAEEETDHSECRHTPAGQWGWCILPEAGPGRRQRQRFPEVTRKGRRAGRACQTRCALRRSVPSPRSTGPAAGAGRQARQGATSNYADNRSQMARKAGSTGCRRVGPDVSCPAGVTWSGYTQCHPWWRCRTMAGSCRAGCGPGGRSCAGWSRGSGLLARSPGAECSPGLSREGGRR